MADYHSYPNSCTAQVSGMPENVLDAGAAATAPSRMSFHKLSMLGHIWRSRNDSLVEWPTVLCASVVHVPDDDDYRTCVVVKNCCIHACVMQDVADVCFLYLYTFILTSLYLIEGLALYLVDWPTIVLQCFDTVGWVIWPVKIDPDMTYNVFGGTLNPTLILCMWWASSLLCV